MFIMRKNLYLHVLYLQCLVCINSYSIYSTSIDNSVDHQKNTASSHVSIHKFSPRLDNNNAWRPVGRGDPLKNDPTYDYSPPTLDRVRYWAETNNSGNAKNHKETRLHTPEPYAVADRIGGANMLRKGVSTERFYNSNSLQKNAKGEIPLLQPKYLAMRRSYYAQAPPMHLMPPPMHKISTTQYHHNMLNYMSESTIPYSKTSPSTMSWVQTSNIPSSIVPLTLQTTRTQAPPPSDTNYQESANYLHFVRPSTMNGAPFSSANAIRTVPNAFKQTTAPRKPWLHALLEKEVVRIQKPVGISTTRAPVVMTTISTSTVTMPTMRTTTVTMNMTTPRMEPTKVTEHASTATFMQELPMESLMSTFAPSTRLIIPNTSNLMYRPTVAPSRMTTESLVKQYNSAHLPLTGPMYLIIEGHSKVKTYGKDELDPHRPKIVPVQPNREPVVRVADPNEQRGTIETFQVKHLHTNAYMTTTPITKLETTTNTPTTTTPTSTTAKAYEIKQNNLTTFETMSASGQGLLNLLDSLFNEDVEPITTAATTKLQMITSTNKSMENITDLTTENTLRGVRQVFDYDQLPELRQKDDNLTYEDSTTEELDNDDEDSETTEKFVNDKDIFSKEEIQDEEDVDEEDDEAEVSSEKFVKRIDKLLADVELENTKDELDDLLSMEDDNEALSLTHTA